MSHEDATIKSIGFEKNRLETLTDGIFAFSMTLLVTGLNIPQSLDEIHDRTCLCAPGKPLAGIYPFFNSFFYHRMVLDYPPCSVP